MPKPRGLNPKQRLFVRHYLRTLNATQAAIDAGYSARNAGKIGPALVGDSRIATAIRQAMDKRAEKLEITADRVLEEIAAVAFAHMGQYATWKDESVRLLDSAEVDPRAVAEVTQRVNRYGNSIGIKLHDKLSALEKLGKHLGMWRDGPGDAGAEPVKGIPSELLDKIR